MENESIIWKILSLCYFFAKLAMIFFILVGLAISKQCQGQVDDILKIFGFYG